MGQYIIVAGYGWSGSSAIVDLLKEFENTYVCDVEFRLVRDPYGLEHLRTILVDKWDLINSYNAIDDFMWLCKGLSRKRNLFRFGRSYNVHLNKNMMKITRDFINDLVDFKYSSHTYFRLLKASRLEYLVRQFANGVERYVGYPNRMNDTAFARPSNSQFTKAAKKYIDTIFERENALGKTIILDQGVSAQHPESLDFFSNAKMIVVDRNPADIYADLIKSKGLIGAELSKTRDCEMYARWHRALRERVEYGPNVMEVKFEDLVERYETTVDRILEFIGWDIGLHIKKLQIFNPSISRGNIGISKEYLTKSEIDMLSRLL